MEVAFNLRMFTSGATHTLEFNFSGKELLMYVVVYTVIELIVVSEMVS